MMERIGPWRQTQWDWRAAGNFICGGLGSGLAVAAGIVGLEHREILRAACLLAALVVACGLGLVWLEIGRPWRFLNVYFHSRTSWMTREALIAPFLIATLLSAAWLERVELAFLAALFGAAFLYAQARMLRASAGIPAWREPRLVPLIVATGLAEGTGGLLLVLPALDIASVGAIALALILVFLRWAAWIAYRACFAHGGGPIGTQRVIARIDFPFFALGTVAPALLLAFGVALPELSPIAVPFAGALMIASGAALKFTIVTRAAFNQGFALPRFPGHGSGAAHGGSRPGWS